MLSFLSHMHALKLFCHACFGRAMHALHAGDRVELHSNFGFCILYVMLAFSAQAQGTCTVRQKKTTGQSFCPCNMVAEEILLHSCKIC